MHLHAECFLFQDLIYRRHILSVNDTDKEACTGLISIDGKVCRPALRQVSRMIRIIQEREIHAFTGKDLVIIFLHIIRFFRNIFHDFVFSRLFCHIIIRFVLVIVRIVFIIIQIIFIIIRIVCVIKGMVPQISPQ